MNKIDIATIQALIQMALRLATPAETLWLNSLYESIQEGLNEQSGSTLHQDSRTTERS